MTKNGQMVFSFAFDKGIISQNEGGEGMFVSRKRWNDLIKRVADLEKNQSQPKIPLVECYGKVLFEIINSERKRTGKIPHSSTATIFDDDI